MTDFGTVVVGAGSSGCALVGRLAELSDDSICLIEAGPDYGPFAGGRWPAELLDSRRLPETHDWGWSELRGGELRPESRAKVVGGCSAHNQCAALWPEPEEHDAWGVASWDARSVHKTRQRIGATIAPRPHAADRLASWQRSFLDAAAAAGHPRLESIAAAEGVAPFDANVREGIRWNAAFAFLDPVRDRVTVFAETVADRLVIDGGRAVAIVCRTREGTHTVEGHRFVLCAGTFASPGVLARSGIGPPAVLERLSVPLQVRADGVGANLHDHCGLAVRFAPSVDAAEALAADLARGTFHQSQVVLRTRDLHIAPFHGRADDGWSFVILAFNLAPRSRGVVEPNADALASPTIDYRFLSDPGGRDAQALEDGLALVRALVRHPPLADAVARELGIVLTGYAHAVGTCRLGAVVDPTCRLSGINNVYVADASIIPTIPRTNPNLLCFLIGHRAAELIDGLSDGRRRAN